MIRKFFAHYCSDVFTASCCCLVSCRFEVKIDNFSFSPTNLTIAVGTTVTWVNHDDIPHSVVSSDEPQVFKSKALDSDDRFSFTFTNAGTYGYFCSIHPKMTGKVVVQ